jgi:outer membrane lipoprotein-sorting protein
MLSLPRLNRRWAVPGIALLTMIGVGTVPHMLGSASADTPDLPALTPAELLAKVRTAQVSALSGTVALTAHLGLPSTDMLGALGGGTPTSLTSLLSGTHTAQVWIDGPEHVRIATAAPMAETNWIRNGTDLWSYDSTTLRATHATLASETDPTPTAPKMIDPMPDPAHETPVQFAQSLLDKVSESTNVSIDTAKYVADQPVYQLVLAPKLAASTIESITISVDAATGLPLDVKVTAKNPSTTALEFGFTHIKYATPSASTFEFTPPPGSTVEQVSSPSALYLPHQQRGPEIRRRVRGPGAGAGRPVPLPDPTMVPAPASPTQGLGDVKTVGTDWGSVAIVPAGQLPLGLGALLNGAPAVTVGSHSGRLITTTLVNVIVLDDGRIALGAVNPDALAAAAASVI